MDNLKLTDKGRKFIQEYMGRVKDKYRLHHLSATLYLSKIPKDLAKNIAFCPFSNKRYTGLRTELLGGKFFYYGKDKAVLYLPDIFGESKEELLDKLHSFIHQVIEILKIEFDVEIEGFEAYKLNTGHVSLMGELKKVNGYFKSGNFCVDCSHGKPEIEAENVNSLFEDIEELRNFKGAINFSRNIIETQEN